MRRKSEKFFEKERTSSQRVYRRTGARKGQQDGWCVISGSRYRDIY